MMARPRVELGSTAGFFPVTTAIAQLKGIHKTLSDMAGDLPGRMIVGLSTTELRRDRMASHGVSARSWFGGTNRKNSGPVWTIPITTTRCLPTLPPILSREKARVRWEAPGRLPYIRMAWDGSTCPAD